MGPQVASRLSVGGTVDTAPVRRHEIGSSTGLTNSACKNDARISRSPSRTCANPSTYSFESTPMPSLTFVGLLVVLRSPKAHSSGEVECPSTCPDVSGLQRVRRSSRQWSGASPPATSTALVSCPRSRWTSWLHHSAEDSRAQARTQNRGRELKSDLFVGRDRGEQRGGNGGVR